MILLENARLNQLKITAKLGSNRSNPCYQTKFNRSNMTAGILGRNLDCLGSQAATHYSHQSWTLVHLA